MRGAMDDGNDVRRTPLRSRGKEAADLLSSPTRAVAGTRLSLSMMARAALVPGRDPHVGATAVEPEFGSRVWAMFCNNGFSAKYTVLPATVTKVTFDEPKRGENRRVVSVHVRWWDGYGDYTHRNAEQVFFRHEVAPGDVLRLNEVFGEVYDDIAEEEEEDHMNTEEVGLEDTRTRLHGVRAALAHSQNALAVAQAALVKAKAQKKKWKSAAQSLAWPVVLGIYTPPRVCTMHHSDSLFAQALVSLHGTPGSSRPFASIPSSGGGGGAATNAAPVQALSVAQPPPPPGPPPPLPPVAAPAPHVYTPPTPEPRRRSDRASKSRDYYLPSEAFDEKLSAWNVDPTKP